MMGPLFYLSRCHMLREVQQASSRPMPEFRPAFADDGFSGGPVLDVWEQFRQEIRLVETYGLKVDPSKYILYFLVGEAFRGDVSCFQALGVKVVIGANLLILKTPINLDTDILHSFQKSKRIELEYIFEALERFPRYHVVFTLMCQGVSYDKIQYWCRMVPRTHLGELLEFFHLRAKHALERMMNMTLNSQQWTQAKLPLDMGGLGLKSPRIELGMQVLHISDIYFISSCRQYNTTIQVLLPPTCVRTPYEGELAAIQHLTPELGTHMATLRDEYQIVRYKDILNILHDSAWKFLVQQADCAGQARLGVVSAMGADAWLRMMPGLVHDSILDNVAFRDIVDLRLGLCLFPGASIYAFYHQNLDEMGYYISSYMG